MNIQLNQASQRSHYEANPATAGRESGFSTSASERRLVPALISLRLLPLTGRRRTPRRRFLVEQYGSSMIETCVLLPVLVLLLIGAVDYGRGFYTSIEVNSASESAAIYGTSNPTDTSGIASMAKMDASDVPTLNVNSSYGCECADGTGAVLSCITPLVCSSNNVVRYVDVSTSATYTPMLPYPLIPSSFALSGHTRMRMSPN